MTERTPGPEILADKIRAELVDRRNAAEMIQRLAAQALDWSVSKMNRVEHGPVVPTRTDVMAMLHVYGVNDEESRFILEKVRAQKRARDAAQGRIDAVHPSFHRFAEYEAYADGISGYYPLYMPYSLQTPEYAASVSEEHDLEEFRRERAKYLMGASGPAIRMIIEESALALVGGDANAFGMVQRANTVGRRMNGEPIDPRRNPNVSIQIAPTNIARHPLMAFSWSTALLEFDDPDLTTKVFALDANPEMPVFEQSLRVGQFAGAFDEVSEELAGPEHTSGRLDYLQAYYSGLLARSA